MYIDVQTTFTVAVP